MIQILIMQSYLTMSYFRGVITEKTRRGDILSHFPIRGCTFITLEKNWPRRATKRDKHFFFKSVIKTKSQEENMHN